MPNSIYDGWCSFAVSDLGNQRQLHSVAEVTGVRPTKLGELQSTVHSHYEDPVFIADRIRRLGFTRASAILATQFPTSKKARSGHIGEVLATEVVPKLFPTFTVPVKRLRWVDGRNLALRGEDIIAVAREGTRVRFLKGEAKSRAVLSATVIREARSALTANSGRPSQFSMAYMMKRLFEAGNNDLAIAFESHLIDKPIAERDLVHMLFTLSGNNSLTPLQADLSTQTSLCEQHSVNLRILDHGDFIASLYGA